MENYTCLEYINLENLNKIISAKKIDDESLTILTKLKTHVRKTGKHEVNFNVKKASNKSKGIGRMYPKYNKPCLQGLNKNIRKALAYDTCVDVDIKNCHPVILNQILRNNEITCEHLNYYVNNRDEVLDMYEDRDLGKERVSTLINGGRPKDFPEFEKLFYDDVMKATERLFRFAKYQPYYKKGEVDRPSNAQGHAVSFLCQDYERRCISSVIEKLRDLNYEPSTIIHDGLLVKTHEILDEDLRQIESFVKQQNHIDIELVIKPMNDFVPEQLWDEDTPYQDDDPNDADEARKFIDYMTDRGHTFVRCKTAIFWFNPDHGIWSDTDLISLRSYIINCDKVSPIYSKGVRHQDNLFTMMKSLIDSDDQFTTKASETTYRKLPFNNGIWDFNTRTLLPFSKDIRFFYKLRWDWGDLDLGLAKEIDERVIYGTLGHVRGDYYKDVLSRAIAGEVADKLFTVVIGEGNSGKGVNCDLFKAFGDFVGTFNAGQLCKKVNVHDNAKAKSWMVALAKKRIAYCSEIPLGSPLDQEAIKSLSSGGDDITGRQNFKDEITFKMECTTFAFLNDIPEIKGSDDAIQNRMRYLETQYVYLTDDQLQGRSYGSHIRKADPNIKVDFCAREDVLRTFAIMICLNYKPMVPQAPKEVLAETKEWVSPDNMTEKLKELFVITGDEEDFITSKHLNHLCKCAGIEASPTRIGRMMRGAGIVSADKKVNGKTTRAYVGIKLPEPYLNETNDI